MCAYYLCRERAVRLQQQQQARSRPSFLKNGLFRNLRGRCRRQPSTKQASKSELKSFVIRSRLNGGPDSSTEPQKDAPRRQMSPDAVVAIATSSCASGHRSDWWAKKSCEGGGLAWQTVG